MGCELILWRARVGRFGGGHFHHSTDTSYQSSTSRGTIILRLLIVILLCIGGIEPNPGPKSVPAANDSSTQATLEGFVIRKDDSQPRTSSPTTKTLRIGEENLVLHLSATSINQVNDSFHSNCFDNEENQSLLNDKLPDHLNDDHSNIHNDTYDSFNLSTSTATELEIKIAKMLSKLQQNVVKSVVDLKQHINVKVGEVVKRVDSQEVRLNNLDNKIMSLEKTIHDQRSSIFNLTSKIDELENRQRRDNVIFRGFDSAKIKSPADCNDALKWLCNDILNLPDVFIDRVHVLGKKIGNTCTLIAKIPFTEDRAAIFRKAKLLRERGFNVSEDFSATMREIQNQLLHHRKQAMAENRRTKLVYDKLIIDGAVFKMIDGVFTRMTTSQPNKPSQPRTNPNYIPVEPRKNSKPPELNMLSRNGTTNVDQTVSNSQVGNLTNIKHVSSASTRGTANVSNFQRTQFVAPTLLPKPTFVVEEASNTPLRLQTA